MALSSSLSLVFLLSTVLAVRSADTGGDTPQKLTPSPRQQAETDYASLAKEGPALFMETGSELVDACNKNNETLMTCFGVLHGNMQLYIAELCGLKPERSDAEFAKAKARLEGLLSGPSGSRISCSEDYLLKEKPLIGKVYKYESMLLVTLNLMKAAAQTQPAPGPRRPGPGRAQTPTA